MFWSNAARNFTSRTECQIVFVEPVGQDSKVAQLINHANH